MLETALTWDLVDWLAATTRLPLLLKGVVRPEDAVRGLDHGAAVTTWDNFVQGGAGSAPTYDGMRHVTFSGRQFMLTNTLDFPIVQGGGFSAVLHIRAHAVVAGDTIFRFTSSAAGDTMMLTIDSGGNLVMIVAGGATQTVGPFP